MRAIMTLERAVALSNEWNIAYLTPIALAGVGQSTRDRDASRKAFPGLNKP